MEIVMARQKDNALVVMHNRLIEARYDLTLQEMRILLWLFSEIKRGDKEFKAYRMAVKDFAEMVGVEKNKKIYEQLIPITKRLNQRLVEIHIPEKKEYMHCTWISSAKYHYGEGIIDITLHPDLLPFLLELTKEFTIFELRYAIALSSIYAIRIYKLLKQYEKIGERTIEIVEIRRCCSIGDEQYKFYKDFRVNIIDRAMREVNEKTDISFDYEEIKTGRKVTSLHFTIKKNTNDQKQVLELIDSTPEVMKKESPYLDKLIVHGVLQATAERLTSEHKPEVIAYNIGQLERNLKAKRGKKIENPAGWLIKAIEEDQGEQKSMFNEQQEVAKKAEADALRKRKERIAELGPMVTKIRNGYTAYLNNAICTVIDGMTKNDRITIEQAFLDNMKNQKGAMIFASRFDGGGGRSWIADPMVRQYGIKYLSDHCPDFTIIEKPAYAKRHGVENFEELELEYTELTK
jgi:plasmid replication initiation protein